MMAHHAVDFWLSNKEASSSKNGVTIGADGTVSLTVAKDNNIEGLKRLRQELRVHAQRPR